MTLRVLTWNLRWRRPGSAAGRQMQRLLQKRSPEIAVLTEIAGEGYLSDGHRIFSDSDYGYPAPQHRRKVMMWSRAPWRDVDRAEEAGFPPGRFVAGTPSSSVGDVRVFGVCIPWSMAHVSSGRRDRSPWEDHLRFLDALSRAVDEALAHAPHVVVAGDFNQRIPKTRQPRQVWAGLQNAMADLEVTTAGAIPGLERPVIDHIATGPTLRAEEVRGFCRSHPDLGDLTDHDGVVADLVSE